ncbi:MAG: hypothetical protein KBC84_06980 [Proteobacteria bacterium]|nr:hypothetical protein [Pseudomonadota bacterium]
MCFYLATFGNCQQPLANLVFLDKIYRKSLDSNFDLRSSTELEKAAIVAANASEGMDAIELLMSTDLCIKELLAIPEIKAFTDMAIEKGFSVAALRTSATDLDPVLGHVFIPILDSVKLKGLSAILRSKKHKANFLKAVCAYLNKNISRERTADIAKKDRVKGLVKTLCEEPKARYHQFLAADDLEFILGELQKSACDIKSPGHYILRQAALGVHDCVDGELLPELDLPARIEESISACRTSKINGEVIIHVPITNNRHYRLVSVTINSSSEKTEIIRVELSNSYGPPSSKSEKFSSIEEALRSRLEKVLIRCKPEWFSRECEMINTYRGDQSDTYTCGGRTIQEALRKCGLKLGKIAFDQSQDGSRGVVLREVESEIVLARLALKDSSKLTEVQRGEYRELLTPRELSAKEKAIVAAIELSRIPEKERVSMPKSVPKPKPVTPEIKEASSQTISFSTSKPLSKPVRFYLVPKQTESIVDTKLASTYKSALTLKKVLKIIGRAMLSVTIMPIYNLAKFLTRIILITLFRTVPKVFSEVFLGKTKKPVTGSYRSSYKMTEDISRVARAASDLDTKTPHVSP